MKNTINEHTPLHGGEQVPEEALEEKNDKPAGLTVKWSIIISVAVLLIIYFLFFYNR